jgi:Protein of unknown function DUF45
LNIAVFGGKLPPLVDITFIRHKKTYAWAVPADNGRIGLTIQPTFTSRLLFLMVLVHEMVHAWEHFTGRYMTHGPQFYRWRPKIVRATSLELQLRLQDV